MDGQVLFIQGGGSDEDYVADAEMVASLKHHLGAQYTMYYPRLQPDHSQPDFGRTRQIGKELDKLKGEVILAGHSLGASMVLKYLTEQQVTANIRAVFLLSTPYWSGNEEWKEGLKLREDIAGSIPEGIRVFLYHCRDDEEVPFDDLRCYAEKLPMAVVREINEGGHQFNNDLEMVANDIRSL